ncbi:uncharacterized protein LOC144584835 isoform X1 [Pogona vitticeps]
MRLMLPVLLLLVLIGRLIHINNQDIILSFSAGLIEAVKYLRDGVAGRETKMASHRPVDGPSVPEQPTAATSGVSQVMAHGSSPLPTLFLQQPYKEDMPGASTSLLDAEAPSMIRTPLRSQQEKGSIEERLKVFCYLPKRREPLGCYLSRSIPSKVDSFRKKMPTETSQD